MDLAADFNNIGVALHRSHRYEEAEEMFKGAVQVLLRSKGGMLLNPNCINNNNNNNNNNNSRCDMFDALVQDDQIRQAASMIESNAYRLHNLQGDDSEGAVHIPIRQESTAASPSFVNFPSSSTDPSSSSTSSSSSSWPPSTSFPSSPRLNQAHHQQDHQHQQQHGFLFRQIDLSHQQHHIHQHHHQQQGAPIATSASSFTSWNTTLPPISYSSPSPALNPAWQFQPSPPSSVNIGPSSSLSSSSAPPLPPHRSPRLFGDEFSAYICLDAIQLDASAATSATTAATTSLSASSSPSTSSSVQRSNDMNMDVKMTGMDNQHHHGHDDDDDDGSIGRYDLETIVVLYNMALTLHCLDQLTLSCYIYDLADRVLRGQPLEKVKKDHVVCKLAMSISNNLGQIFLKMGYMDLARAYVHRLATFLIAMDPPTNAEQAKERLEFVLNIYWFNNPPSAPAA